MYKVKDENGNTVHGMLKDNKGNIVVTDTDAYNKYMNEKERAMKLKHLEKEVSEIKSTMTEILTLLKNSRAG